MQQVSAEYKAEMESQFRKPAEIKVYMGVIAVDAAEDASPTASAGLYYSKLDGLVYDRVPEKTYATFEAGRWRCDGSGLVPAQGDILEQGFVGEELAGADGVYDPQPFVRFDFSEKHTAPAISLVFDPSCADFPERIRLAAFRDGQVLAEQDIMPNAASYVWRERLVNFNRLDVVFIKARYAGRRARLQQVKFGYGLNFGQNELKQAAVSYERDPINRRLPIGQMNFTVLNFDGEYDLDNPLGVWQDMEKRTPLNAELEQSVEGGAQIVPLGRFYLSSAPVGKKNEVKFAATDILGLMTNSFYKGKWQTDNLYELCLDVLQSAGLPRLADGSEAWKIWEGLREFEGILPASVLSGRELLQLIAHAAMCVLYVDREGHICIEPIDETQHDLFLDYQTSEYGSIMEQPEVEKTPILQSVAVYANYFADEDKLSEVHKGVYEIDGRQSVHVEFGGAVKNVEIELNSGEYTAEIYAYAADIDIEAEGEVSLIIRGVRQALSQAAAVAENDLEIENGFKEEITNPLIGSYAHALNVAEWVKEYLLLRSAYSFKYRGSPEVDALDRIYMQSRFTDKFAACVLKQKINYSGTISGEMIAKRLEE